jgi:hypothetical protein
VQVLVKRSFHVVRPYLLAFVFFMVLLLPGLLIGTYFFKDTEGLFLFGAVPVAAAVFSGNRRLTLRFSLATALIGWLALVFAPHVLLSTALIAGASGLVGLTARRGNQRPAILMVVTLGFVVVSPPVFNWQDGGAVVESPWYALIGALILLLGGLWATAIGYVVRNKIPIGPAPVERDLSVVIPYALALVVSTGMATFIVLEYWPGGLGAWIILTVLVVVQPEPDTMKTKVMYRVGGTLVGGAMSIFLLLVLEVFDLQSGYMQLFFAFICISMAMAYFQSGPYWKFVVFLTPGVVLLDSNHASNQVQVAETRVLFTLIGAVLAVLIALTIRELAKKIPYSGS